MRSGGKIKGLLAALAAAAIIAAGLSAALNLDFKEDVTAVFPEGSRAVSDFRLVISSFRIIDALYIDVGPGEGGKFDEEMIAAVVDVIGRELSATKIFGTVYYRFSGDGFPELMEKVSKAGAHLIEKDDLEELERFLSPDEMRVRLQSARRSLAGPEGIFLEEGIRRDPLGIGRLVFEKWRSAGDIDGAELKNGLIWDKDGRRVMIIARPDFASMETDKARELVEAFEQAAARALTNVPPGSVRISWTGGHRSASENSAVIKADISRAVTVATLAIGVVGLFVFRRFLWTALIFLPAAVGMAAGLRLTGLVAGNLSAIAVGLAAALAGITVDYGIHILYGYQSGVRRGLTMRGHLRSVTPPLLAGAATTTVATLSLISSSLPIIRQVGIFAGISVAAAAIFALFGLAPLAGRIHSADKERLFDLKHFCEKALCRRARHPRLVMLIAGGVLAAAVVGLFVFEFDGEADGLNYRSRAYKEDEMLIRHAWGDLSGVVAVVRGKTLEEALQQNDELSAVLDDLRARGVVTGFSSISSILPSEAKQRANRQRWLAFWSAEKIDKTRRAMGAAAEDAGFSAAAFAPFFEGLLAPSDPLRPEDFADSDFACLLESRISSRGEEPAVLTTFRTGGAATFAEAEKAVMAALPEAVIVNPGAFSTEVVRIVSSELVRISLVACAVAGVVLLIMFGRADITIMCIVPVILAVLTTIGVLGLTGVKLNVMSCLFVAFVFGVGLDYGIFLTYNALKIYRGHSGDVAVVFGCVLACALTSMCGFGAMTASRHPALFSVGLTGTVGLASSLFWAWVLVPALSERLLPKEGRPHSPTLVTIFGGVYTGIYCLVWWLTYMLVVRPGMTVFYRGDKAGRRRLVRGYIRMVASGLMRHFPYPRSAVRYIGAEDERLGKAAIIVSNHLAAVDILYLLSLPADMVMMVKEWVLAFPLIGRFAKDAGYLCARRDGFDEMLEAASRCLAEGVSVAVFPEGSRSPDAYMRRFHKGAFEIAAQTGADVLPVLLTNTQAATPKGAFWVGSHDISLRVCERVTPENFDYRQGSRALSLHVRDIVRDFQAADWRLSQRGTPFYLNIRNLYGYMGPYVELYIAWKLRLDPIYCKIDELVGEKARVLDLGCGYGLMSNILARKSTERFVTGLDFDERKIRIARRTRLETRNTEFQLKDFICDELPGADAVLLIDVLHYWEPGLQERIISKAAGCLTPGGVMVFREAMERPGLGHAVTAFLERLSTGIGHNRRGDGLHFMERSFYDEAFRKCGLVVRREVDAAGRGSNATLLLEKRICAL